MITKDSVILHHCLACEHKFEAKPTFAKTKESKLTHMGFKKKCPNCGYISGARDEPDAIQRQVGLLDDNGRIKLKLVRIHKDG